MTETVAITRTLTIERELPHPPEKVWRALTESSLIQEWLMGNDFEPKSATDSNSAPLPCRTGTE